MEIRKFIISLVSKFDNKGFKTADKEGKALAKTVSTMTKSFEGLVKSQLKAAQSALALARAEDKAGDNIDTLQKEVDRLKKKLEDLRKKNRSVANSFEAVGKKIDGARRVMEPFGQVGRIAANGLLAFAGAGAAVATGVIATGTSFESLRARLKTVEGSAEGASIAFAQIQEFTKTTPFQLEDVTTAFVRLKSLGLDASKESLTAFGNLSAAQGKSIIDFIEAVADASTGEFERLKEFGIKASSQGDKVSFAFKGTTTTVGKNAAEIQAFLKNLGQTEFAGAMDDQMATASGAISNLKDTFATFLDQVAQMGVLDEFKLLLADVSGLAGNEGFAGILAEGLVSALQRLREWLASVTEQDIREFLEGANELAESLFDGISSLIEVFRWFVGVSGDVAGGIQNIALVVAALQVALTGPVGLVVAAGLAGAALGSMAGVAYNSAKAMSTVNAAVLADLQNQVAELQKLSHATDVLNAKIKTHNQAFAEDVRNRQKKRKELIAGVTGGLGEGLTKDVAEKDLQRVASLLQAGGREQELGLRSVLTSEGRQVLEAVEAAGQKQITAAEDRARKEARRRGAKQDAIDKAAENARAAAVAKVSATREKALKEANIAFQETGSVQVAVSAATKKLAGKKRGKKGKGDTFFEFEKDAKKAAETQGEKFAEQTLRQLRAEGVAVNEALERAKQAGKDRAKDLEKQFLEAGRIFDASANNILDVLGLRGPGSVLEKRPPPQSLIIAPQITIKFIENFTQQIGQVTGALALEEITGEGGAQAVEAGLETSRAAFEKMMSAFFNLQMERFLKLAGGGTLPAGPEQG